MVLRSIYRNCDNVMERIINIDGTGRCFKASGATPRVYRGVCGRDLMVDLSIIEKHAAVVEAERQAAEAENREPEKIEFTTEILTIYEDLAYTMLKQGNQTLPDGDARKIMPFPDTPDEWLDGLEILDIYDILPQIIRLWSESERATVSSKKNRAAAAGH